MEKEILEGQVEQLQQVYKSLPAADQDFAKSLIAQYQKKSFLSMKQEYWVGKLLDAANGKPDKVRSNSAAGLGDFSGVYAMLDGAKQHLQFPSIHLSVLGVEVELYLSGPKAKTPGMLNIVSAGGFAKRNWFGRLTKDGVWLQGNGMTEDFIEALSSVLIDLGLDPAETIARHGRMIGRCCFCWSQLTDKRSLAAGFGETCSKHYGLHDHWADAVFEEVA
jgi:hypothetical protein